MPRHLSPALPFLVAAVVFATLTGCGQKGPLMRPETAPQSPITIRPAPTTAPAAAPTAPPAATPATRLQG